MPRHRGRTNTRLSAAQRESEAVALLLTAYRQGAFPMATSRRGRVDFFQADPRSILPLDDGALIVPRSLRAALRRTALTFTTDIAFEMVIRACADTPRDIALRLRRDAATGAGESQARVGEPETWINDWIIENYTALHRAGHAHSIEAWLPRAAHPALEASVELPPASSPTPVPMPRRSPTPAHLPTTETHQLVAGLYGVHLGGAFFGESMFSRPDLGGSNASKMCLAHLWHHLRDRGFVLLDTQIANDHMRQFGIVELPLSVFSQRLAGALAVGRSWGVLRPVSF